MLINPFATTIQPHCISTTVRGFTSRRWPKESIQQLHHRVIASLLLNITSAAVVSLTLLSSYDPSVFSPPATALYTTNMTCSPLWGGCGEGAGPPLVLPVAAAAAGCPVNPL